MPGPVYENNNTYDNNNAATGKHNKVHTLGSNYMNGGDNTNVMAENNMSNPDAMTQSTGPVFERGNLQNDRTNLGRDAALGTTTMGSDNFNDRTMGSNNLNDRTMDSSMSNTGMTGATVMGTEAGVFNPDPSLRNNNYNTMTEYERLQSVNAGFNNNSGLNNTTSTMGTGMTGSTMRSGDEFGTGMTGSTMRSGDEFGTGMTGSTMRSGDEFGTGAGFNDRSTLGREDRDLVNREGAIGTESSFTPAAEHQASMNQYGANSSIVGNTGVVGGTGTGLGSSTTGTYADDNNSSYSRDTAGSNNNNNSMASSNSKGQHSTLHGQTEKLTGSVQAALGKALKKPAMTEAGQEKKMAGQEEVTLAKEEKAMKKNH